jgi:hypothetical protein
MLECYAKKTEEGVEVTKSTISATRKRKRDDDEESSITEKRPKVAAIETGVQEERRIWENESGGRGFLDEPREAPARPVYICGVNNRKRSQANNQVLERRISREDGKQ